MESYKVLVGSIALLDIQEITNYYNKCLPKLGSRFQKLVKQQIGTLKNNAELYSIRYGEVHCMYVRKFPYLVHFTIDSKNRIVEVFAVIHTSRSPDIWEERNKLL
ncbi:MAG: type II toxin-antitoxin system RelE/ParE family toxin [Sphingobacteriales bacterium]